MDDWVCSLYKVLTACVGMGIAFFIGILQGKFSERNRCIDIVRYAMGEIPCSRVVIRARSCITRGRSVKEAKEDIDEVVKEKDSEK